MNIVQVFAEIVAAKQQWDQFIELFEEVVCMLTKAFILRFNIEQEVFTKVPQAKKELF